MPRFLPLAAPLGAALFTVAWLALGTMSPGYRLFDLVIEPYSPISQPVSGLGLGVTGAWMNAAFIVGGALLLAGAAGVAMAWPSTRLRRTSLTLIALTGLGMAVDGVFTLESPMLHLAGFLLAVPLPALGFLIGAASLRRHWRAVSRWLMLAGVLSLVLFVVFMMIFDPYSAGDGSGIAGLVQRALITVVLAAQAMLGVAAFRALRAAPPGTSVLGRAQRSRARTRHQAV